MRSLFKLLLILKADSVLGLLVHAALELMSLAMDSSGDIVGCNRISAAEAIAGVAYSMLSPASSLHATGCCCFAWIDFVKELGSDLPKEGRPGVFFTQISEIKSRSK